MNRFLPDTWWEALMRPLAMAAPDGNVYVEIMAPDLRYAFAILLAMLLAISWRRITGPRRGVGILALLTVVAFIPWMATTGNGRYFLALLLLAGPLAIALVYLQPWSRGARALCALCMVALQAYVVFDTRPVGAWSLAQWRGAPYFEATIPRELRETPATYVTITSISYSLLYPQFHPGSSWINITGMSGDPRSTDTRRAHELLARATRLYALVPTVPDHAGPDHLPTEQLKDVVDMHLASQRLAVDRTGACHVLPSRSAAHMAFGESAGSRSKEALAKVGFWVCPLRYPVVRPPAPAPDASVEAVFQRLEQQCPGIFPPDSGATNMLEGGAMRNYAGADIKAYVMRDGYVYYKYFRSLNHERIASIEEMMAPAYRMDCTNIRGRSGLPWQRSI